MTLVAGLLVALSTVWLAWRGYRRGAAAALRGWLPRLSAISGGYLAAWLAWSTTGSVAVTCLLASVAAALAYGAAALALWPRRRRAGESPPPDGGVPAADGRPRLLDRLAGAGLGVLHAEICCLALACLGSTVVFGMSLSKTPDAGTDAAAPLPRWAVGLGTACRTVAGISEIGLLRRIPLLTEYGREVLPLIAILNAPREKLARIAEKRDLMKFAEIPAMQEALLDREYFDLLERARRGELSALRDLSTSPVTRGLLACPEIREFAKTVTPSQLVKDMEDPSGGRSIERETESSPAPAATSVFALRPATR
jgi:hypothetical protein